MASDARHRRTTRSWPKALGNRLYGSLSALLSIIPNLVDTDPFHGAGLALPGPRRKRGARRGVLRPPPARPRWRASRAQNPSGQPENKSAPPKAAILCPPASPTGCLRCRHHKNQGQYTVFRCLGLGLRQPGPWSREKWFTVPNLIRRAKDGGETGPYQRDLVSPGEIERLAQVQPQFVEVARDKAPTP